MMVLVTGASGQLGQSLLSIAAEYPEIKFYFAGSNEADITDRHSLESVFHTIKPDFCINAAAYTAVDKAESEPEKAYAINVSGAKKLAEICKEFDTTLIHVSTDFVFDGNKSEPYTETDAVNPQGVYAQTKLQGEQAIIETLEKYYIIRTSWLYSEFGNNFMKTMLRLAKDRDALSVVSDQSGTPTHAVDLAKAIVVIIRSNKKAYGIYHYSNEGTTTWYGFAAKIFETNNMSINLQPIPTTSYPTPAKRPAYSVLDKSKIKSTFGLDIRNWENALTAYQE